jgi:thiol-disulfide isomerase/thioredoxin
LRTNTRFAITPPSSRVELIVTNLDFQIRSLPTVIAFRDGEPVSKFIGALPETHIRDFIGTV